MFLFSSTILAPMIAAGKFSAQSRFVLTSHRDLYWLFHTYRCQHHNEWQLLQPDNATSLHLIPGNRQVMQPGDQMHRTHRINKWDNGRGEHSKCKQKRKTSHVSCIFSSYPQCSLHLNGAHSLSELLMTVPNNIPSHARNCLRSPNLVQGLNQRYALTRNRLYALKRRSTSKPPKRKTPSNWSPQEVQILQGFNYIFQEKTSTLSNKRGKSCWYK
jgi:hypothetical protein